MMMTRFGCGPPPGALDGGTGAGCNTGFRMPSGDFLLIDNSNSFTKLSLASRGELLGKPRRVDTRTLSVDSMKKALRGWRFGSVVLSSVVPEKGEMIAGVLRNSPLIRVSS